MQDGLGDGGFETRQNLGVAGSASVDGTLNVIGNTTTEDVAITGSAYVKTGKFIDAADEGAVRVEGAAVVAYNTGTTQYSIEAGAGSITSGSEHVASFTTAFQTVPIVQHNLVFGGVGGDGGVEVTTIGSAHGAIGSVTTTAFNIVNAGSGAGFTYIACGQKA